MQNFRKITDYIYSQYDLTLCVRFNNLSMFVMILRTIYKDNVLLNLKNDIVVENIIKLIYNKYDFMIEFLKCVNTLFKNDYESNYKIYYF